MDERRRTPTELHVSTTGQLYSFRPEGSPLEARTGIFSAQRYGSGPDAVLVTYGIQGEGYFQGIKEHFDMICAGVRLTMGWVWQRHTPIYRRVLRGIAEVEVLMSGHPYGEDGPMMDWLLVWKGKR